MNSKQTEFYWWFGRIEDRNDPEQNGRVRVRIFNIHGDKASMPTDTLHWSAGIMPITSPSQNGIGRSPTGLQEGSIVWGFFLDGMMAQQPIIVGVWPGSDGVPQNAKGADIAKKTPVGPEPSSPFAAQYPYNQVWQTESGHIFETDDTPNAERIHQYHRSGTYSEVDHEGRRVNKIVGDDFLIIEKDRTVYVQGDVKVQILGDATIDVSGSTKLTSASVEVTAPTSIKGNLTVDGKVDITGDVSTKGKVTAVGDVMAGLISLENHTHPGVLPGPSVTGPPLP